MLTMATTLIRPATIADVDVLRSVLARANEPFRDLVPESLFDSYLRSALDVEGRMGQGDVLVAELDGEVVGTITFYGDANDEGMPVRFPGGTCGIRATAVDPIARGQGIGRALVMACIERAAASGATHLGLHTASFMVAAVGLYETSGFRRSPGHDFEWSQFFPAEPGADLPAIAYLRPIQ